jgi:hypothetical protein
MRSVKRFLIAMGVVLGMVIASLSVACAATCGAPDGDGHPYVGLVLFYDGSGNYMWRCSGTLLSPTVFLTAGHCTYGTDYAIVLFDTDLTELESLPSPSDPPNSGPYLHRLGTPYAHFDYDDYWTEFPNTYDVGVVVLDEPIEMAEYGTLPEELGVLDELDTRRGHQNLVFRTVGYGLQSVKPKYQGDLVRYTSTSMLINLRSNLTDGYNIHTSNNPGKGHGTSGGSCIGDSGGPLFYPEDSNIVVGIVSFGMNNNCKGADWGYRTDIPETQDFVLDFLE